MGGRITDASTGAPLPGATVAIVGTTLGAAADDDGAYALPVVPAGVHTLRASLVGYTSDEREVTVRPGERLQVDFVLAEATAALDEVTVTGNVEAAAVRESPFAVTVIDGQRLAGRGLTVDEAISRAAGVQVRRSGGLGSPSVFSVRGLEGQRVQIYLDGNAADVAGDALTLDNIPLQLVERVEVYKGVVPAQFGGDGLGSAINVVTIHPEGGYLDAGYTLGSFGQHQISVTGQRPLGIGFEAVVTVNFDRADNDYVMENPFQPGLVVRRDHDRIGRGLVGFALTNDRTWFDEVGIEGVVIHERRQVQGVQTNIQHAEARSGFGALKLEGEREGALGGRLSLRTALIGLWAYGSLVDTSAVRYGWDGTTRPSPNGRGEIGFYPSDSDNRTTFYRYRFAGAFRASPAHTVNLTGVFDQTAFRPSNPLANAFAGRNVADFPGDQTSAVVGLSHEWRPLGERFVAVTGARGYAYAASGTPSALFNPSTEEPERVESGAATLGASFALRYRLGGGVLAKAAVERAHRLPSTFELFGDVPLHFGVDAEVQGDVTGWLYARAYGTYLDARDVLRTEPGTSAPSPTYGLRVPNLPYLFGGLQVEAYWDGLVGRDSRTKAFYEAQFTEEYFYAFEVSQRQERRIPRALTHTVGAEAAWLGAGLTVLAEVQNVTDATVLNQFNLPLPGRAFRLKLRYTLVGSR